MDNAIINVVGDFYDYDIKDKIFLKAKMLNNNLEGIAQYYYGNGKMREEGVYQNNVRQGKWTFYYQNGNVQKVYEYVNGEPTVLEAYSSSGKAIVVNGNGNFKTEFSTYKQCDKFEAYGQLMNGKKIGKWTLSNLNALLPIATEIYEEGNFIKGIRNNNEYTQNSKIRFTNFYANENLNLLDNAFGCPGDFVSFWKYDDENIHSSFYPELQEKLIKYTDAAKNQWLVVGISINKKNKIKQVNVASSINDESLEKYVYDLLTKMTRWQTAVLNSRKTESNIFFTVLVDNNQIIIPTDYIFNNRGN
jgi:antitoxin component YwqK of YwqJK toxin-antitoxin module